MNFNVIKLSALILAKMALNNCDILGLEKVGIVVNYRSKSVPQITALLFITLPSRHINRF
jgi:hypothetical protein